MGDQGRWFKLWITAPADPHLGNLSLEDFARWCLFGVYMKVHGTDGVVTLQPPMTALQNSFRVHDADDVITTIKKFPNCTVAPVTNSPVSLQVEWKNWHKYQGDFSTDRVRRWRKEKRQSETPKKRREETRRDEKRKTPSYAPPIGDSLPELLKTAKITPSLWQDIQDALDRTAFLREAKRLRDPHWWGAQLEACGDRIDPAHEVADAEAYLVRTPTKRAQYRDLARFLGNSMIRHAKEADLGG